MFLLIIILIYCFVILIVGLKQYQGEADYLIVLGSALKNNQITKQLQYRLDKALAYCLLHQNCLIIVSGGICHDNNISEASLMRSYLIEKGFKKEMIIVEDQANDTIENFKYSFKFIEHKSRIVVVSTYYHLLRSKMICKMLGYKIETIGAKTDFNKLICHLFLEEIFIVKNFIELKKQGY